MKGYVIFAAWVIGTTLNSPFDLRALGDAEIAMAVVGRSLRTAPDAESGNDQFGENFEVGGGYMLSGNIAPLFGRYAIKAGLLCVKGPRAGCRRVFKDVYGRLYLERVVGTGPSGPIRYVAEPLR